jgi:hypothetical protein
LITMRLTGRTFTPKLKLSIMTRPDSERPWKSCRLGVKRNRPSTFGGLLIADESRPAASRKFGISRYSYVFTPCQTGSSTLKTDAFVKISKQHAPTLTAPTCLQQSQ